MTYESLRSLCVFTGIAALVLVAISAVLFFVLNIPDAIAFLTGRARRKGIEMIRQENGSDSVSGMKKAKHEKKADAGKSGVRKQNKPVKMPSRTATTERLSRTVSGTEPLDPGQTMPLDMQESQTAVLSSDVGATTLLAADQMQQPVPQTEELCVPSVEFSDQPFTVEFEITFLTSDIVIEREVG